MKIAIVTAAGRTGALITAKALAAGHDVTAIARRPHLAGGNVTRVAADVMEPDSLTGVFAGHDAVISTLGATSRGPITLYSAGTAAIISAMTLAGTRRLIVLSSAGIAVPPGASMATRALGSVLYRIMRHTYDDMTEMERLLASSALDWTAIRPTGLHDDRGTGDPRASIGATTRLGSRTSRHDLAHYILNHIDDPATYRTVVAVSS